jgi:hypothetical protein
VANSLLGTVGGLTGGAVTGSLNLPGSTGDSALGQAVNNLTEALSPSPTRSARC